MENNATNQKKAESNLIRYCGEFSDVIAQNSKGSYIYTSNGKAILDFTSGQMCSVFGHNHPKIVEALKKFDNKAIHLLSSMLSPEVIDLSKKITEILPDELSKIIFVNTGSESNEVAIRMAKLHTQGFEVMGFAGSWHGMTAGSQSYTYSLTRKGYGPNIPGSHIIPAPYSYRCPIKHCNQICDNTCLEVGMELADKKSVGAYSAFIAEPVLSAAGIIELTPAYMKRLKELCDERGLLLILDEAQTAFGRLGYNFAFEDLGVTPDFLTLSKTLGGGLPLAATITNKNIEENCYNKGFIYITSHVSDPFCAAMGLVTLDILLQEQMSKQAKEKGAYLKKQLLQLQEKYDCIGDVRGKGLLLGMEIVKSKNTKEPDIEMGNLISNKCLELGLSMNIVRIKGYGGVFRIAPPLNITKEEIDLGISILDKAISLTLNLSNKF